MKNWEKASMGRSLQRLKRIKRAHELDDKGLTLFEIATRLGVKQRRVSEYLKEPVPTESEVNPKASNDD